MTSNIQNKSVQPQSSYNKAVEIRFKFHETSKINEKINKLKGEIETNNDLIRGLNNRKTSMKPKNFFDKIKKLFNSEFKKSISEVEKEITSHKRANKEIEAKIKKNENKIKLRLASEKFIEASDNILKNSSGIPNPVNTQQDINLFKNQISANNELIKLNHEFKANLNPTKLVDKLKNLFNKEVREFNSIINNEVISLKNKNKELASDVKTLEKIALKENEIHNLDQKRVAISGTIKLMKSLEEDKLKLSKINNSLKSKKPFHSTALRDVAILENNIKATSSHLKAIGVNPEKASIKKLERDLAKVEKNISKLEKA